MGAYHWWGKQGKTAEVMKHVKVSVTNKTTVTLDSGVNIADKDSVWVYDAADSNLNKEVTVESVSKNVITVTSTEATEVEVFYLVKVQDVYNINIKATNFPESICCIR